MDREDNWEDFSDLRERAQKAEWRTAQVNRDHIVFDANLERQVWRLRMNDFPDEPLYTLIVDNQEIIHFNDWPANWKKRPQFPDV